MRKRSTVLLCALLLGWAQPVQARYGDAVLLFNLKDARIDESSGLASSSQAGILFTHNDSEDLPPFRFFAVGAQGQTHAVYQVLGAVNTDWEDMAKGPGTDGTPSLYLGDIGDNLLSPQGGIRPFLPVYEVKEPVVDTAADRTVVRLPVVSTTRLIYPDGGHDCESLFVHPETGQIGVVTKDPEGHSGVYVGVPVVPGVQLLAKVASIDFGAIARPFQPTDYDQTSRLSATGADIAPDGTRFVVRTYVEAFEWDISQGLTEGLSQEPLRIPLPFTRQGEAIAYSRDGHSLLTTSEQLPAPVHEVPHL